MSLANLGTVAVSADSDLLELGNPDWHHAVALWSGGEVVAIFRAKKCQVDKFPASNN